MNNVDVKSEELANQILDEMHTQAPHFLLGYTQEIADAANGRYDELVAFVDDRKTHSQTLSEENQYIDDPALSVAAAVCVPVSAVDRGAYRSLQRCSRGHRRSRGHRPGRWGGLLPFLPGVGEKSAAGQPLRRGSGHAARRRGSVLLLRVAGGGPVPFAAVFRFLRLF